ncbi:MAG: LamG-like jellyroll fold domain-containing protein [Sedimentisphaerales bacterium]
MKIKIILLFTITLLNCAMATLPQIDFPYGFYSAKSSYTNDNILWQAALDDIQSAHMNIVGYPFGQTVCSDFYSKITAHNMQYIPIIGFSIHSESPSWPTSETVLDCVDRELIVWDKKMRSLISWGARYEVRYGIQTALQQLASTQSFGNDFYFGDDVALNRNGPAVGSPPYIPITDYSQCAIDAFTAKTGLSAPRPGPNDLAAVSGVIPEFDPWLKWHIFRCSDVFAGYHQAAISMSQTVNPQSRGGAMPGSVWSINHGVDPYYQYQGNTNGFSAYYHYPNLAIQYLAECELSRMGGKNRELWVVPLFYNDIYGQNFVTPEYTRTAFFSCLTAGAKGITYFYYSPPAPTNPTWSSIWQEATANGAILQQHGELLHQLTIKNRSIALLASFSTDIYQLYAGDLDLWLGENTHRAALRRTYLNLLQAQLPVEIVHEEQLISGVLSQYSVLVLPHVNVLRQNAYNAIVNYIQGGGMVIIDQPSAIDIPGATKIAYDLSQGYDVWNMNRSQINTAVADARSVFYPLVSPVLVCDRSDIVVMPVTDATQANYYYVLNAGNSNVTAKFTPRSNELAWTDVFNSIPYMNWGIDGNVPLSLKAGEARLIKITDENSCDSVKARGLKFESDVNSDCHVNMFDFSEIAKSWFFDYRPQGPTETVYSVPTAALSTDVNTVVLLHFNENAGCPSTTTAVDSSGKSNNATVVGQNIGYNNTWVKFGASAALHTDWVNSNYFKITDKSSLDFKQASIEAFFLCNDSIGISDSMVLVARNTTAANGGFAIYMDPLGDGVPADQYATIWAQIAGVDLNKTGGTGKHTVIQNDIAYHHVALTFSNGIAKLFFDGVIEDEKVSSYSILPASSSNITIGGGGAYIGWKGRIDELRISNLDRGLLPVGLSCADIWSQGNGNHVDINKDCIIDFQDIKELANQWLLCNDPEDYLCNQN